MLRGGTSKLATGTAGVYVGTTQEQLQGVGTRQDRLNGDANDVALALHSRLVTIIAALRLPSPLLAAAVAVPQVAQSRNPRAGSRHGHLYHKTR